MKASILKAVVWNSRGYVGPSGDGATSGYPAEHGFGHEEWNNHPAWTWRGYRVFHTESQDRLLDFSKEGELGMLMIASHDARQYAVGVAAGAFDNTSEEMSLISADLNLYEKWQELWHLDLVRRKHNEDLTVFLAFWRQQCRWVRWKVDPRMYHWFKEPIELDPMELVGRQRLATMFSRYQPIRPERIARAIRRYVPKSKRDLVAWFEDEAFDERFLEGKHHRRANRAARKGHAHSGKGNAPTSRTVSYWVYGERLAEPLHHVLQARYVAFLRACGLDPVENRDYVDVRYTQNGKLVLVEVKPTEKVPPKYAIRIAIGQLLEYRHVLDPTAELEIVLSTEPDAAHVGLLKALGIRLWYKKGKGFTQLT